MSFKNLTEVDREVYWSYNLTFRERRLGNEVGATDEISEEYLGSDLAILLRFNKLDTHSG